MLGRLERIVPVTGHSFRVLRWSENLREVDSVIDAKHTKRIPGAGDRWHYHVEMELTVFTKGQGAIFVGDHIGPFESGEILLLGENLPHHWNVRGPCAGHSVQWNFPPKHAFWAFPETFPLAELFRRSAHGIRFGGQTASDVTDGLRQIVLVDGLERLGQLFRLLAILANAPSTDQTLLSRHAFSLPTDSLHQEAISEAMRHLVANFRNEIRLDEVLNLTGMSKTTFSRQFKVHSGKTFSEFVAHLRLQAASRELIETNRSILEIAYSCGFTEISFFNRIFRRIMHCSPSEFRARERLSPARAGLASGVEAEFP